MKPLSFPSTLASPGEAAGYRSFGASRDAKRRPTDPFVGIPILPSPYTGGRTLIGHLRIPGSMDAAFILAGFSMLLLAPMVEHSITSPREDNEILKPRFDHLTVAFGERSVSEGGLSEMAPGGIIGQSGNVTPLIAPDPTLLVLSPAWPGTSAAVRRPARRSRPAMRNNWKDALTAAVKRGASRGAVSARPPAPARKLVDMLRSLSSRIPSGSRSAAMAPLEAPSSNRLIASSPSAKSNLSHVLVPKEYHGAWRSSAMGTGGGPGGGFLQTGKSLMTPGGISSGGTNVPGVEGSALSERSSASGDGPPKVEDADKSSHISSSKSDRNITITKKEDLSLERRKLEMQKAIELKWAKRQYDQLERKKMLEEIAAQTASQALLKVLDALLQASKGKGDGGGGGGE